MSNFASICAVFALAWLFVQYTVHKGWWGIDDQRSQFKTWQKRAAEIAASVELEEERIYKARETLAAVTAAALSAEATRAHLRDENSRLIASNANLEAYAPMEEAR